MSKSAHSKSTYRLKPLPRCLKCKNKEMILVMVSYENKKGNFWEWECLKCHKTYPKNKIKEQLHSKEDMFLHTWCENDREQQQKERNTR